MSSGQGSLSLGDRSLPNDDNASESALEALLSETSRTFALSIPLLPFPVRKDVTIAYLLLRIADTIEDSVRLPLTEKQDLFQQLFDQLDPKTNRTTVGLIFQTQPCDDVHHLELLNQSAFVIREAHQTPPIVRQAILGKARQSVRGMSRFVASGDGSIRLESLPQLRDYCYCVAGLVGELLTDLFVGRDPHLSSVRDPLNEHARWFGEGLQLVNVLKDSNSDADEGRRFIPMDVSRQELFALARSDLERASKYVDLLRAAGAHQGVIAFTDLPLQLAWRTLEFVEESGPGSKVPRTEVHQILQRVHTTSLRPQQKRPQRHGHL